MLEPRRLLTFREVARQGSFSRAAQMLSLTQPAVSQQVRALEEELGARLLDRGQGGLALTEAGLLLLEHADAISDRIDLADTQLGELVAAAAAQLRVGSFPSALATIVPDAMAGLRDHSDLRVEVAEGSTQELAGSVRRGELHLAVCFEDAAQPPHSEPGLRRHELAEEPMDAAVGPDHPLTGRRSIALRSLADDTWTAPSPNRLVYRACVAAGFEPRIDYITRDALAIRALVANGLAVTIMPRLLAGELPGVRTLPLASNAPSRRLYALTPEAGTSDTARAFIVAVEASIRSRRAQTSSET